MSLSRFLIWDKGGEIRCLFIENKIYQASHVSLCVLMACGQSWQILWCLWWLSKLCCMRGLWSWRVPRHHTALPGVTASAFSVALLKGMLRCCCALNSAEAAPWEAVFLRHGLKVPGRLLWVTCWVNKFLPSWTTPSIWANIKLHLPDQWLQAWLWHSPVHAARSSHSGWHIKSDFVNVAPSLNGEK